MQVSTPAALDRTAESVSGADSTRYVVLEEIGRGAMGSVLRAYDAKLRREVALKQVHPGALGSGAIRQLVDEARAMAKLSHPNVVAVYDVEPLVSGQVVLVMQYVAGQTLRRWLRAEARDWPAIVERFAAAGDGLQAAHDAGLLHRDFKPANVLITESREEHPESAVRSSSSVKVTDFGIAKIVADEGPSTGSEGHQDSRAPRQPGDSGIAGTPRYMAPEQHRGDALTAAADQYAFCVALWEALCGSPPFSGANMEADKESGPPAWPEASTPAWLVAAVVRGLAPRPEQRWPSIGVLVDAIRGDPKRGRARWWLGSGGVLGLAGLLALVTTQRSEACRGAQARLAGIWDEGQKDAIRRAILGVDRSFATAAWERTQAELDAYATDWSGMATEACEATVVSRTQPSRVLDLRMACLDRRLQELAAVSSTLASADEGVVLRIFELIGSLRPVSICADIDALSASVEPPPPTEASAVSEGRAQLARANAMLQVSRLQEAAQSIETARTTLSSVSYAPVRAEWAAQQALLLERQGDYPGAATELSRALRLAVESSHWETAGRAAEQLVFVVGYRQQRGEGLHYRVLAEKLAGEDPIQRAALATSLGSVFQGQGKLDEAEASMRRALTLRLASLPADHPDIALSRSNLGTILESLGRFDEAESEHRLALEARIRTMGEDHPDVGGSYNNLGIVLSRTGRLEEAEEAFRRGIEIRRPILGDDHPHIASAHMNLATCLHDQGRYDEAVAENQIALTSLSQTLGPQHPSVATARDNLGLALFGRGEYEQAAKAHSVALEVRLQAHGPEHPGVATSRVNLGNALNALGDHEGARRQIELGLSTFTELLGAGHPSVAVTRNNLGNVLLELHRYDEAEVEYRAARSSWEASLGLQHPFIAAALTNLAKVRLARGDAKSALPLAEDGWQRRRKPGFPPEHRAESAFVLARVLWAFHGASGGADRRRRAEARTLAREALDLYEAAGPGYAKEVQDIRQWLASPR